MGGIPGPGVLVTPRFPPVTLGFASDPAQLQGRALNQRSVGRFVLCVAPASVPDRRAGHKPLAKGRGHPLPEKSGSSTGT